MKRANELNSYNLDHGCVYEAWKLIAFGYADGAKTTAMLGATNLFFHDMICDSNSQDVYKDQQSYWKNRVCTEFKAYESDYKDKMDSLVWRELYCSYSNQMKDILTRCKKWNSIHERMVKFQMQEILEPITQYLSSPYANKEAQYYLAESYYYGYASDVEDKEAFMYYKLSADQGHMEAQYQVAQCYNDGVEEDPDGVLSFKYFKLSADQGNADAQYMVGIFYEEHYVEDEQWTEKAFEYFTKAATQGHTEAIYRLANLAKADLDY